MSDQQPKISACICTYNRDEFLYKALESLGHQSLDPNDYEVLLIDNNSTDTTPQLAKTYETSHPNLNFSYVIETSQGLSHARNRAIQESAAPLIVYIDDDAIASEDFLRTLVDFFNSHQQVMAGGGKIIPYFYPSGNYPVWMSHYLLGLISCVDHGDKVKPYPTYPIGCNMVFRKTTFDIVGQFDPRLGRKEKNLIGSEEKELFIRIKEAGLPVYYIPDAWVYHTIPEERISMPYVRRMSIGVGQSERIRFRNGRIKQKLQIFRIQTIKTLGTLLIAIGYFLRGEREKGKMLLKFRRWFFTGFLRVQDPTP